MTEYPEIVIDELSKCVDSIKGDGKVATVEFARGVARFAAAFVYGCAPSPIHATRLFFAAMDAVLRDAEEGYEAFLAGEAEEGVDEQAGTVPEATTEIEDYRRRDYRVKCLCCKRYMRCTAEPTEATPARRRPPPHATRCTECPANHFGCGCPDKLDWEERVRIDKEHRAVCPGRTT